MNEITCSNCSTPNDAGARFCTHCGHAVAPATGGNQTQVYAATVVGTGPVTGAPCATMVQPRLDGGPPSVPLAPPTTGEVPPDPNQRELTMIVVDESTSMGERFDKGVDKIEAAIRAGCNLIASKAMIDPDDEVGLVTFTESGRIVQPVRPLHSDRRELVKAIQHLSAGGGTDLNAGLTCAEQALDWSRTQVVRRIVMLTDGEGGHPVRTAKRLKDRGVVIDVIGVGADTRGVNEKLLRKVASTVGGELHYRFIRDCQSLLTHFSQLGNKTRTV